MLLIPAENGFNKNNLPWLTFILIILNLLAFSILQGKDQKLYNQALYHYSQNELLAVEKPLFKSYSERYRSNIYQEMKSNNLSERELISIILFDKRFTNYIKEQNLGNDWLQKRIKVNDKIAKTSTYQYSYYPSEPSWFTALSHMFMHGDIYHLLGNMIFLFLFGYNLELVFGRLKMLFTYFASGLVAVVFFAYTSDDKFIPLVGASGAISGLMGGFAGYYGIKRIRYLFWIFVYFNYIRLPAFLVLIYWLLKELVQAPNNDGVAYMAHFGGLVAGVVIVLLLKIATSNTSKSQIDSARTSPANSGNNSAHSGTETLIQTADQSNSRQQLLNKAKQAVKDLEFDLAKDYYQQLISNEPSNASYYKALYSLEKDNPASSIYSELVSSIINRMNSNSSFEALADTALEDIKAHLGHFNAYQAETLMLYCQNCLKRKQPKLIRNVINHLIKHHKEHQELPNLLLHFAFAIEKTGDWNSKHKVLTYLSQNFTDSFAGQEAKRELEANH